MAKLWQTRFARANIATTGRARLYALSYVTLISLGYMAFSKLQESLNCRAKMSKSAVNAVNLVKLRE